MQVKKSKNFEILAIVAAVVAVCGLSLIIDPAITGDVSLWLTTTTLAIFANGLLVGTVYAGYQAIFNPQPSFSDYANTFIQGFVVGCVSSAFSLSASSFVFEFSELLNEFMPILLPPDFAAFLLGTVYGLVTNTLANWMNDRDLFDNWKLAMMTGGIINCFNFGLQFGFNPETEKNVVAVINFFEKAIGGVRPALREQWMEVARAICQFRKYGERASLVAAGGNVILASFTLWAKVAGGKTDEAAIEDSSETFGRPRTASFGGDDAPGAVSPSSSAVETVDTQEKTLDRPLATEDQNSSSVSYDPGNDESNVATSAPSDLLPSANISIGSRERISILQDELVARETLVEIPCPLKSQTRAPEKYDKSSRDSPEIRRLITTFQDKLPSETFDGNALITNMNELITLHGKYEKISKQFKEDLKNKQDNPEYVYTATTDGGMRLGGAGSSQDSSSSQQESSHSSELGNKDERKHQSNPESTEEEKRRDEFSNLITAIRQTIPDKKIAKLHRLITIDKVNNYELTDRAEWPKFDGNMRVIGLMGSPKSGKTTLGQAILFKLGYSLSLEHITATRIPFGIHAYVLHDEKLIIVECCEGIDPLCGSRDQNMSQSPLGALLLELFMYLFCMKIIYTVPFNAGITKEIKKYAKNRIFMFMLGAVAHEAARYQQISFVLRVNEEKKLYEGAAGVLRNYLTIPQKQLSLYEKIWKQEANDLEMEHIRALNTITVNALRLYKLEDSTEEMEEYDSQLQDIIDMITSVANAEEGNKGLMNDQPIDCDRFHDTLDLIWKKLAESETLKNLIANIRAEEEIKSGEDSFKVKEFFTQVSDFLKKLSQSGFKGIVDDYHNHIQEMKQKAEKFNKLPKDKQTPELFVASVIKAAHLILRKSLKIDNNSTLQEEGIRIGLHGFVILVKEGANTMIETMALRMALFDCELIKYLKLPKIYNHYPECWFLLTRLARNGFRLPVLEFDIWKAANVHLERKHLNTDYEANIYLEIHCLLEDLTHADAARCIPSTDRHTGIFFSRDLPVELIAFNFEKSVKEDVQNMLTKVSKDPKMAQSIYNNQWIKLPETWFNNSEFSAAEFDTEEERTRSVEKLLGTLMSRNFEIIYRLIAELFSQEVVKRSDLFLTTKFDDKNTQIGKMRLLLWKNTAENAKLNKNVFCSLLDSNLLEFLIEQFINKNETSPNFPQAHNTLCAIIGAEGSHKEDESVKRHILENCAPETQNNHSNVYRMSEIAERERRWKLAERWTLTRLRCLECGVVGKLISYFCQNTHPEGIEFLLSALVTYFVNGRNESEKHLSETIYLARRHALLNRVAGEMNISVNKLNVMKKNGDLIEATNYYEYQRQISVLKVGCQFINHILAIYYNDKPNSARFFNNIEEDSETFKTLVCAASKLYPICTSVAVTKSEKDKLLEMHYFNMVLNLASVAQKSINTILLNHGITNIGTVDHTADPIQITRTEDEFLNLKMDTDYKYHHKLVIVSADLLKVEDSFVIIKDTFTKQIKQLQCDIKRLNEEKRKYNEWVDKETRRRQEKTYDATKETKLAVTSLPMIASSSTSEIEYAIDDLPYWSPVFGHHWSRNPSYEDIKQSCGESVSEAFLDAYALFIFNNVNQKKGEFGELLTFFQKLTKSPKKLYQIRKENEFVDKMLQVLHVEEILGKCGYSLQTKIVNNIQEEHFVTNDENFKSEYATLFCQEIISLKERNARLLLDSRFIPVPVGMDLKKQLLPSAFFDPVHKDYAFHSKLSIQELLDRRPRLDRVPSQLRYTLVRVSHKDTGDCYQAVFTSEDKVYYVLEQLSSWGITCLYKEEDGDLDEKRTKELREIGGFVIQLTCY